MNAISTKSTFATLVGRLIAGGMVGAAASAVFLTAFGEQLRQSNDPGIRVALTTGMVYVLMGLMVGFGVLFRSAGARLLNVEDVSELVEEQSKIRQGATSCLLIGIAIWLLAFAATPSSKGIFPPDVAALAAVACVVAILLIGIRSRAWADEFSRQMSVRASALTFRAGLFLLGSWAGFAHLGYVSWISPLLLISSVAILHLLAIFWVGWRIGLLRTRGTLTLRRSIDRVSSH